MEIIGGGGHDRSNWEKRREEYLHPEEPFGLCSSNIVPDKYKPMCYIYMTPFAYEALGADMAYPAPEIYEQTFALCEKIPIDRVEERKACFGGLGKEFIGVAIGRNFAPEAEPKKEHLQLMYDWCLLAEPSDGRTYCVNSVADSLYWGGERPFETTLLYCSLIDEPNLSDSCYREAINNVGFYVDDPVYRESFCTALPADQSEECRTRLFGNENNE